MKIKIFCDSADLEVIRRFNKNPLVSGFTTNPSLMRLLGTRLKKHRIRDLEALGMLSEAKEAVAFAVLANETVSGKPGNVPGATGATHPVVLGVIAPGAGARFSVD